MLHHTAPGLVTIRLKDSARWPLVRKFPQSATLFHTSVFTKMVRVMELNPMPSDLLGKGFRLRAYDVLHGTMSAYERVGRPRLYRVERLNRSVALALRLAELRLRIAV